MCNMKFIRMVRYLTAVRQVKRMSMMPSNIPDLSNWMGNLDPVLKDVPLIYLAIPGSHDSMTYGITDSSDISPDAENIVRKLTYFCHGTVMRWAVTQTFDIKQQLYSGIRYLDFRLATRKPHPGIYFVHGLYADEITSSLTDIRDFLDSHLKEVVIIDCQHFYAFKEDDHIRFSKMLDAIFDYRICSKTSNISSCSLNSLTNKREQIIIIYRSSVASIKNKYWPSEAWANPWPNQNNTRRLLTSLQNGLRKRIPNRGYVTQCVLTPTVSFIVLRYRSNLKKKCAKPVSAEIFPWIATLQPGKPTINSPRVNVFLADFVELPDYGFCKMVIGLNRKLLDELTVVDPI